jgi:hypothetical protein
MLPREWESQQDSYGMLHHAFATVGVNTFGMIDAVINDKPRMAPLTMSTMPLSAKRSISNISWRLMCWRLAIAFLLVQQSWQPRCVTGIKKSGSVAV